MTPVRTPEEANPESSVTPVDTGDEMEEIDVEHQDTTTALSAKETTEEQGELSSSSTSASDDKIDVSSSVVDSHTEEKKRLFGRLLDFYFKNEFLIMILLAIALAKAYPPLGAEYLKPDITATWVAVVIIFVLVGLGLKTEEFSQAFKRLGFNVFVQVFNFGFVSAVVFGFTRFLISVDWVNEDLAAGMVVCSCLPMAINVVIVLTASAGGDEAAAVFNTTFGNILGIFLSPALILGYLGSSSDIALVDIFYKLSLRVVLPLAVGQLLQKFSPPIVAFASKHKRRFKKAQEYCLVFIVYTVFCKTFESGERNAGLGDVFLMIFFQFLLMISLMAVAWYSLGFTFPDQPKSRVMGVFGCTMKTVALGIPMINSIYENDPNMGLYALPLLIWHPMQLVIGTIMTPRLVAYIEMEEKRLEDEKEEEKRVNYNRRQTALTAMNEDEGSSSNGVEAPVDRKEETSTNEKAV